jgi:hypothetical protein
MARTDEPGTGGKAGDRPPVADEPAADDRKVDLTPFDFLSVRLRGPAGDEAEPPSGAAAGEHA